MIHWGEVPTIMVSYLIARVIIGVILLHQTLAAHRSLRAVQDRLEKIRAKDSVTKDATEKAIWTREFRQ